MSNHPLTREEILAWPAVGPMGLKAERALALLERAEKAERFKVFVHERLDAMGVPADPEPEANAKHGCRIEGRLSWLESWLEKHEKEFLEMVAQMRTQVADLGQQLETTKAEAATHWANFCERSGDFRRWRKAQRELDAMRVKQAEAERERVKFVEAAALCVAALDGPGNEKARHAAIDAMDKAVAPSRAESVAWVSRQVAAAQARERELRAALDRDKTGLAAALNRIIDHVNGFTWLLDGRGAYEWDDDRYRDEAGHAMRPTIEIAEKALAASGSLANGALSAPQDTTALREFGLKVVAKTLGFKRDEVGDATATAIVDAVLKGDGHPLADAFMANEGPMGGLPEGDPTKGGP